MPPYKPRKTRLQRLKAEHRAALDFDASDIRWCMGDFLRSPSAKNYREVEKALVEYQQKFQQYEGKR
jgi:hypothetical protein